MNKRKQVNVEVEVHLEACFDRASRLSETPLEPTLSRMALSYFGLTNADVARDSDLVVVLF